MSNLIKTTRSAGAFQLKLFDRHSGLQSSLLERSNFGSNPGNLRMLSFVPPGYNGRMPLVVVLHGCTQTAAGYDHGTGWSALGDRYGFATVFPEQRRDNNPNGCFNWFQPSDNQRDGGEPLSIVQMVSRMVDDGVVEPDSVYVTGLSAGGAMAAVLLATYPDVFAAGSVIAGLPYGSAKTVSEAFQAMAHARQNSAAEWGQMVRGASPHRSSPPRISIWHGTNDRTVSPKNAEALIAQWTYLHGVTDTLPLTESIRGHQRRSWRSPDGIELVADYRIAGMGHGAPIATGNSEFPHENVGPFLLEAGISSTLEIARFCGLISEAKSPADRSQNASVSVKSKIDALPTTNNERSDSIVDHVQSVIKKALTAAGLLPS